MTTATVYKLPDMYRMDSKGKTRIRKSIVRANGDGTATWTIETGILDGALVRKDTLYKDGKQGRNAFEQACFDANSKHESKQKKEKYQENIEDIAPAGDFELMVPMTAIKYEDARGLELPYYMQPKLDGNRCMIRITSNGEITKWSREGNLFANLEHLDHTLQAIGEAYYKAEWEEDAPLPELILDGELFTWDMPFKDINGALKSPKKYLNELKGNPLEKAKDQLRRRELIQFWWFDVVNELPFKQRFNILKTIGDLIKLPSGSYDTTIKNGPVVVVPIYCPGIQRAAELTHSNMITWGFEGSMIRTIDSMYEHKRSKTLLKRKDWKDAEFRVLRIEPMEKSPTHGMYVCENPENEEEFKVTPKCSHEERAELLAHPERVVGKMLTVVYFETFEDGTPRFGAGIRIREER